MTRPYYRVKHVETMALLPATLIPGRIYFVDDEQVIVIDHGNGFPPVIYGGKPGPAGPAGSPQPSIQEQIDTLSQTELAIGSIIWDEGSRFRSELSRIEENFSRTFKFLRELSDKNAQAVLTLGHTIKQACDEYDTSIATLAKAVSNLYPDGTYHDDSDSDTPSANRTLLQSLNIGDTFKANGADFTVSSYTVNPDDSISMGVQSPKPPLAEGDTVEADGAVYTIAKIEQGTDGSISLTLE